MDSHAEINLGGLVLRDQGEQEPANPLQMGLQGPGERTRHVFSLSQPHPAEITQPQRCTFYVYCMQKNDPTLKRSGSPHFLGITTFNLLPVEFSQ